MKLEEKELQQLHEARQKFNEAKMTLGDIELNKQVVLREIDKIRSDFTKLESALIEKYGIDSQINMQTGEITKKNNETLQKV